MPALLPSELPVRCRVRQHWIVLIKPPHKLLVLAFVILLVAAVVDPNPIAWVLGALFAIMALLRWQTWRAERVILTGKRIIRLQGVPETTTSETSLRVDRISGARLVETVPGKLLGYGTIELEAPGEHPGVRKLVKIEHPQEFYLELRSIIFGEPSATHTDDFGDPDGPVRRPVIRDHDTAPLPRVDPARLDPPRDRFGRRRDW